MARRGRPGKTGKRERNGRLQRDSNAPANFIRPSEWVQSRKDRFGEHYSSALGRAYAAGLLGEGVEGKARLDAAKRFTRLYARFIGGTAYSCALNHENRGGHAVSMEITDQQEKEHRWLFAAMDSMDVAGVRPYFDQLISALHVDAGPYWLDALLIGGKHPADRMVLKAAIQALDILAPEVRQARILAVVT